MASKIDQLHNLFPKIFNTKNNKDWKAVIEAVGQVDQDTADLLENVKNQLTVSTAAKPYLDRLGSNFNVQRPSFVGMNDESYRKYIPVLSYSPKQVRLAIDNLLEIFFFRQTTTSSIVNQIESPYDLNDGWQLEYLVDGFKKETITFSTADFTNINAATTDEVVSTINRQANNSFAVKNIDSLNNKDFVQIYTNTIGAKGSIKISAGLANLALRFAGFKTNFGNGSNTQWLVTKIGDLISFKWTGIGTDPLISALQVGDIVLIDLLNNMGSFEIESVDLGNSSFSFRNLFGTIGTYTQTTSNDLRAFDPITNNIYKNDKRAITWETSPNEITVEIPATPPVVRRIIAGAWRINGLSTQMTNRVSNTSLTLLDASDWPNSGSFKLQELKEIQTKTGSTIFTDQFKERLDSQTYTYTGKSTNTLTGISPNIPELASVIDSAISSGSRTSGVVTLVTGTAHGLSVGSNIYIFGSSGPVVPANGIFIVKSIVSTTSFTYESLGDNAAITGGTVRFERPGMANSGSFLYLYKSLLNTGIEANYMWDVRAPFVLSSLSASLLTEINAGDNKRFINVGTNAIPNQDGFLIFNYGKTNQEGPVRFLSKASDTIIALDPTFTFQNNHNASTSAVTFLRRKGGVVFAGDGSELAPYVTDPGIARVILIDLIKKVKSSGMFLNAVIRYPALYYNDLDVYNSGQ